MPQKTIMSLDPTSIFLPEINDEPFDYDTMLDTRVSIRNGAIRLYQHLNDTDLARGDLDVFREELEKVPEELHGTPEYNLLLGIYLGREHEAFEKLNKPCR